jgi:5-methylcytosine-specific restriction endonuclease McrA
MTVWKRPRLRLNRESYLFLHRSALERDGWRRQSCGSRMGLEVHHMIPRSQLGHDEEQNLITLCWECHRRIHSDGAGRHDGGQ